MNKYSTFKHTHLWNNLPDSERQRLAPCLLEAHILHLEQTRETIQRHHNHAINDINAHIRNLKHTLGKQEKALQDASDNG